MHKFDYKNQINELYSPDVVRLLKGISEYKGKQSLYLDAKPDVLNDLLKFAKINSSIFSNKIEGIEIDEKIADSLIKGQVEPTSRNEEEVNGYKNVLELIHENYRYIDIKSRIIRQLHKELYKDTNLSFAGEFKSTDNIIQEIDKNGNRKVRFYTVPAILTETMVDEMCNNFNECWNDPYVDNMLLSFMFILDFLCIHPFDDGNGRLSRLLSLLLMYKDDYIVGKYVSIEKNIEKSKDNYYSSLKKSSSNWHENKNNYEYFVRYMLGVIMATYKDFESCINKCENIDTKGGKPVIVETAVEETLGKQTKREIREKCPGVSDVTIARTLSKLQKEGKVKKIGGGRYTYYVATFN